MFDCCSRNLDRILASNVNNSNFRSSEGTVATQWRKMKDYKQTIRDQLYTLLGLLSPTVLKRQLYKQYLDLSWSNIRQRQLDPELLIAQDLVGAESVVFDIGANRGMYTLMLTERVRAENVFAFEPNPVLYRQLKRLFPSINIHPIALSDQNGIASFKIPYINHYAYPSRGTLQTNFKEDNETNQRLFSVETIRLDDFVIHNKITKLDLLKIDVEGHEYSVLKGGKNTLRDLQPSIIIEIEQRHHDDIDASEIIEFICSCGYEAYYFSWEKPGLEQFGRIDNVISPDGSNENGRYVYNFVFIPISIDFKDSLNRISQNAESAENSS